MCATAQRRIVLKTQVTMQPVSPDDRTDFLRMAEEHFRELNPAFIPQADWKSCYLDGILGNRRLAVRWILLDGKRCGFILFGTEDHRFLPRQTGAIYELYVDREHRLQGVGRACALEAIRELQAAAPSKVQLEIMEGNTGAEKLWKSLGFRKVSERWVLSELQP